MKRGIVVSDLHVGSWDGLLLRGYVTSEGVEKLQNPGQEYLEQCWLDFVNRVERFDPDFVIANGDLVDGPQRKSQGAELSLPNPRDQKEACIAALRPLRAVTRRAEWFFTQGTPYHVSYWGEAEEDIAQAMGATPYPSVGSGKLCREVLKMDFEGVILEAAHHIAFSSVYKATPLEKEVQATWMAHAVHKAILPDIQIRSHVHTKRALHHPTGITVTTPCWKLQDRFPRKSSLYRILPDIGGTYITLDGQAKLEGRRCCDAWFEPYDLPPLPIAIFGSQNPPPTSGSR